MAVHMFRVFMEDTRPRYSLALARTWIDDWVADQDTWTGDPVQHEIYAHNTQPDGSGLDYFGGDFRFEITDSEATVAQQFSTFVGVFTSWHRLLYHLCDHDENERTGCEFSQTFSGGTVPQEIPNI